MFFKKIIKYFTSCTKTPFEKAFSERLGQTPVEFIYTKLAAGSDKGSVEYLYNITAAEIARKNHCVPKPFAVFYPEAEQMLQPQKAELKQLEESIQQNQTVQEAIKICQREFLNCKDSKPFGARYEEQLRAIYEDKAFCGGIMQISKENSEVELCIDAQMPEFIRFKREILPKRMKELGLTAHPAVRLICDQVVKSGRSQKSALITIYYAVRMKMLLESKEH